MKKLLSDSDRSIYSYTHTHTQVCDDLRADGCHRICLLLPVAQPNLHNVIALFGKLITTPPPVVEEQCGAVGRQPNDPLSLFRNEHACLSYYTSFSASIPRCCCILVYFIALKLKPSIDIKS